MSKIDKFCRDFCIFSATGISTCTWHRTLIETKFDFGPGILVSTCSIEQVYQLESFKFECIMHVATLWTGQQHSISGMKQFEPGYRKWSIDHSSRFHWKVNIFSEFWKIISTSPSLSPGPRLLGLLHDMMWLSLGNMFADSTGAARRSEALRSKV